MDDAANLTICSHSDWENEIGPLISSNQMFRISVLFGDDAAEIHEKWLNMAMVINTAVKIVHNRGRINIFTHISQFLRSS
ncbi:MAG: hypothetical protein B1H11_00555 [Desulfobacteraceae bacterium 4484_190.1]|nr:MAG: hypothetical protein B1H11_00555 [Desulfobacteraceae bacterium 4484_190.1]